VFDPSQAGKICSNQPPARWGAVRCCETAAISGFLARLLSYVAGRQAQDGGQTRLGLTEGYWSDDDAVNMTLLHKYCAGRSWPAPLLELSVILL